MTPADSAAVLVIHGLWLTGIEYTALRHRLQARLHLPCEQFSYSSVGQAFEENLDALASALAGFGSKTAHIVAHSLGGILTVAVLQARRPANVGRVVLLGSPLTGSAVARTVHEWPFLRGMLGGATDALITPPVTEVPDGYEVGAIAGSRGAGLGRVVGGLETPHDGTVAVAETRLPGLADHVTLDVGHMGMLVSRATARLAAGFIADGSFGEARPRVSS